MTTALLCPGCLSELPEAYSHDHVLIDRALAGQPDAFRSMTTGERIETLTTGLDRGLTITALATLLRISVHRIRTLLPADHPEAPAGHAARTAILNDQVSALWHQGLPDTVISLRLGRNVYQIARVRRDLGLPTHPRKPSRFKAGDFA